MWGFLPISLSSVTLCCVRAATEQRGAQRGQWCRRPGDARRAARPAHATHVHESGGAAQNPAAATGPGATCAALRGPAGAGACAGTAGTARPLAAAVRRAAMGRAVRRCGTARHGRRWKGPRPGCGGAERSGERRRAGSPRPRGRRCGRGGAGGGARRGCGGARAAAPAGKGPGSGGAGAAGGGVPAERAPPLRAVTASDAAPRGALAHAPLTGLRPEVPEARASPGSTMASACLKEKPPLRPPGE